jgi:Fe2+ or Zn2+ uptake regulation protein
MSRGLGAIQRAVLDALSDKPIVTLSTIDLAHMINHGVRSKSVLASVHRALRTLEAVGKVVRVEGKWVLATRQGKLEATTAENGRLRVKTND